MTRVPVPPVPTAPAQFPFRMLGSTADLAVLVKAARSALGLSRAQAAARCRVGPRFIFDVESGKPSVQLDKVLAVMNGLGLIAMVMPVVAVRQALSR